MARTAREFNIFFSICRCISRNIKVLTLVLFFRWWAYYYVVILTDFTGLHAPMITVIKRVLRFIRRTSTLDRIPCGGPYVSHHSSSNLSLQSYILHTHSRLHSSKMNTMIKCDNVCIFLGNPPFVSHLFQF